MKLRKQRGEDRWTILSKAGVSLGYVSMGDEGGLWVRLGGAIHHGEIAELHAALDRLRAVLEAKT